MATPTHFITARKALFALLAFQACGSGSGTFSHRDGAAEFPPTGDGSGDFPGCETLTGEIEVANASDLDTQAQGFDANSLVPRVVGR